MRAEGEHQNCQFLPQLESLRGLCAVSVALLHFQAVSPIYHLAFIRNSYLFVDLFFVISGYVMAHVHGAKLRSGSCSCMTFMIRRIARIYPAHLAVVLLLLVLETMRAAATLLGWVRGGELFSGSKSPESLLANMLLVQGLHLFQHSTWNGPAWSISVEFWTYVVFGLSSTVLRAYYRVFALAILFMAALWLVSLGKSDLNVTVDFGLLRCLYGFMIGTLAQDLGQRMTGTGIATNRFALSAAQWGLAISCAIAMVFLPRASFVFMPLGYAALVLLLALGNGTLSRVLSWPPLVALGGVSYSLYLVHVPVQQIMFQLAAAFERLSGHRVIVAHISGSDSPFIGPDAVTGSLAYVVMLAVAILAAIVLRRSVEAPMRERIITWSNR